MRNSDNAFLDSKTNNNKNAEGHMLYICFSTNKPCSSLFTI